MADKREFVTTVDVYVMAESQEEAQQITHDLLERVLTTPAVTQVDAEAPPAPC